MKLSTTIAAAAAVIAMGAAGWTFAQPGAGFGPGYGMGPGMHGGMGMGMGAGMGPQGEAYIAGRLTDLKAELKITSTQDSAWAAFETQSKEQAASAQALHAQMHEQMFSGNAFDPTTWHEQMSKLFEARSTALKNLYAVLTPEQRATADRRLSPMGPHFMGYGARAR